MVRRVATECRLKRAGIRSWVLSLSRGPRWNQGLAGRRRRSRPYRSAQERPAIVLGRSRGCRVSARRVGRCLQGERLSRRGAQTVKTRATVAFAYRSRGAPHWGGGFLVFGPEQIASGDSESWIPLRRRCRCENRPRLGNGRSRGGVGGRPGLTFRRDRAWRAVIRLTWLLPRA